MEGCLFAKVLLVPFCKGFECTSFQQRQGENTFFAKVHQGPDMAQKLQVESKKSKPVDEYNIYRVNNYNCILVLCAECDHYYYLILFLFVLCVCGRVHLFV